VASGAVDLAVVVSEENPYNQPTTKTPNPVILSKNPCKSASKKSAESVINKKARDVRRERKAR
jgi:hypothetical protein